MKNYSILLAGLAAAAFTTQALADVTIRITGSTAMRDQIHNVLVASTGATPAGLGFTADAWIGNSTSTAQKSTYAIYSNGTTPNKVTVKTSWGGSTGGIKTVAEQRTDVNYLADVGTVVGGTTVVAGFNNANLFETGAGTTPDLAFSDCYQLSSKNLLPELFDTICGIVPFRMVTNFGSPIKSCNYKQIRTLFTAGRLPLSTFTGNAADTAFVYAIGRDPDSGTRVTLLAESGIGANTAVKQYLPHQNGTAMDTLAIYPDTTLLGETFTNGNGGYASGGTLAKDMRFSTAAVSVNGAAAAPIYFITNLSKGDSDTAIAAASGSTVGAGPAKIISIEGSDGQVTTDGVTFTNADFATVVAPAVKTGGHPLWGYLHCFRVTTLDDTQGKLTFYNNLTTKLTTQAPNGIALGDMLVERQIDGGKVTPK